MIREGLEFVSSIDPRLDINNLHNKQFAVLKSGNRQNFWQFPLQGTPGAVTQLNWNATVPDMSTYVNRRCYINLTGVLSFTGTSVDGVQPLLQCQGYAAAPGVDTGTQNFDSLRCLPMSQLFQSFTVTLNNNAITQNVGAYSRIFQRFQRTYQDQNVDLSMSPAMPDYSFSYADLNGTYLNPQGNYGDNQIDPRGAFTGVTVLTNTPTSATVQFNITEPFWLSPFAWAKDDEPVSLLGIRNFNVAALLGGRGNSPIAGPAGSMWSHAQIAGQSGTITQGNLNITSGTLFLNYLSPSDAQSLPPKIYYSWVNPTYYQQTVPGVPSYPSSNSSIQQNSQTIQLNSNPSRIYVWVEKADSLQDMTQTDTFGFRIDKIAIRYDTVSSILNDCTPQDLYQMSSRNGCNITWNQWNGTTCPTAFGGKKVTGVGSIMCINMGLDVPLPPGQAPGQEGKHTMQITVNATNVSGVDYTGQQLSVNVLVCEEGVMLNDNGTIQFSSGVIKESDVLATAKMHPISHVPSKNVLGGSFWDDIKRFFIKAGPGVFRAVAPALPPLVGHVGEAVLQSYGKGGMHGKHKGGAVMSRKQLLLE
jgi:hypothetical protein